jgi:hypothetical protein
MTQNQDLRAELLRRAEQDQAARRASRLAAWQAVARVEHVHRLERLSLSSPRRR